MGREGNGEGAAQQQELIRLLCRGLSRLAVASQGVDRRLDPLLADLRKLLRKDPADTTDLNTLIDAIDSRIKDVDDTRSRHATALTDALERLVTQLLAIRPAREVAMDLKGLQKKIRDVADESVVPFLLTYAGLQAQALNAQPARPGLWSRWFGGEPEASAEDRPPAVATEPVVEPATAVADGPLPVIGNCGAASGLAARETNVEAMPAAANPDVVGAPATSAPATASGAVSADDGSGDEPPFSRISHAVCDVITLLLRQIDPPVQAAQNHENILDRIAAGLNWYELVPVLEDLSIVVLAALERDRGEFHQYLLQLNQRLATATQVLQASRQHQSERQQADAELNQVVRGSIAAMQQGVAEATDLNLLKTEVTSRLESVVYAMDSHRNAETGRHRAMEQYLTVLEQRIHAMEEQSASMERQMAEQRRLALVDILTQLPNRHAYDERLEYEFDRWQRYRRPLVLAICDVDHFKSINDNFGHLAGDKVLRILARTLRKRLRKTDFVARYGGEEFVVLLPETDQTEALAALEMVREAVAQCPFHFRDQPLQITLSVGLALFGDGDDANVVFERADRALYSAKQAGRDRCAVAGPEAA